MFAITTSGVWKISVQSSDYDGRPIKRSDDIPDTFEHLNWRSDIDGLACANDGSVFLVRTSGPELFQYDHSGTPTTTPRVVPSKHRQVKDDVPKTSDIRQIMKAWNDLSEYSLTHSVFALRDDVVMIQFIRGNGRKSLQIIDVKSGTGIHNEELESPSFLFAAKNGHVYTQGQSLLTPDGELPNPKIIVYEYLK